MNHIILILFATLMFGCASSAKDQYMSAGNFAAAYEWQIHRSQTASIMERQSLAQKIKSSHLGGRGNIFSQLQKIGATEPFSDAARYLEFKKTLDYALEDGLINGEEYKAVTSKVQDKLIRQSIQSPNLLMDVGIAAAFPGVESEKGTIVFDEFKKLILVENVDVVRLLTIQNVLLKANDIDAAKSVASSIRKRIVEEVAAAKDGFRSVDALNIILTYVGQSNDHDFDEAIKESIRKTELDKAYFFEDEKGERQSIASLFPEFAESEVQRRTILINFIVSGDAVSFGDVIDKIESINPWIMSSEGAGRKVTISRFRIQEQIANPQKFTETVLDPSFSTLLYIPKNASVIFDYLRSDYNIQWSMVLSDQSIKIANKSIAGREQATRIECSNLRYQNVFGGTGALLFPPNDRVASFCSSSRNVNFDGIRDDGYTSIAKDILRMLIPVK